MNNYIQKIVEDFNFNSIQKSNDNASLFTDNILGVVDLGLPSGTLWCKCNLGAKYEYEYGDYYAWGELTTKKEYTIISSYISNPRKLPSNHDVATQKLGNHYCIPTKKQWDELLKYTDSEWIKNYKGTDVNGRLFTSKINGNSIFIPAAGYRYGSSPNLNGSSCYVWSSSICKESPANAWFMFFSTENTEMGADVRYYGQSIRPVFKKSKLTENFDFNQINSRNPYDNIAYDFILSELEDIIHIKFKILNVGEQGIAITPIDQSKLITIKCETIYNGDVKLCDKNLEAFIEKYKIYYIENSVFMHNESTLHYTTIHIPDFIDALGSHSLENCYVRDLYFGKYMTSICSNAFYHANVENVHFNENIDPKFVHPYAFLETYIKPNLYCPNITVKNRFINDIKISPAFAKLLKLEQKQKD